MRITALWHVFCLILLFSCKKDSVVPDSLPVKSDRNPYRFHCNQLIAGTQPLLHRWLSTTGTTVGHDDSRNQSTTGTTTPAAKPTPATSTTYYHLPQVQREIQPQQPARPAAAPTHYAEQLPAKPSTSNYRPGGRDNRPHNHKPATATTATTNCNNQACC